MAATTTAKLGPGYYTSEKDLNLIGKFKPSSTLQGFGTKVKRELSFGTKS